MYKYYKKYVPYLFLLPAGIILILFFFIPFFETILLSFFDYNTNIYNPSFVSLANYTALLKSPVFYKVLINTFIYLIAAVPFLVVFPLIIAIMINQKIRGITLYKILIYLPVIVSIVVAAIAFKWLYAQQGILNYVMALFHIEPVGWLTDPNIALYSVILVTVWKGIGYYMMIYLSALMSVPKDLYEACEVDGANPITKHLTVTLPHLMPTIGLVTMISSISAMKVFVEIYVMTKGGPGTASMVMAMYGYQVSFSQSNMGYGSCISVAIFVLSLLVIGGSQALIKYLTREKEA